jgi:hypothetical protein
MAILSGTPTPGTKTGGTFHLVLTATYGSGKTKQVFTQDFTLTVLQAPILASFKDVTARVGTALTTAFSAVGSPTPSFTETGSLPDGVSFVDNGNGRATLAGTPAPGTGGVYDLTITASNGVGSAASAPFTLTVDQAPVITSASSDTVTRDVAMTPFPVMATGYPSPALKATHLPSGLTMSVGGVISGTPSIRDSGTVAVTITAKNAAGSISQDFELTVTG